jgi:hypothetical protein
LEGKSYKLYGYTSPRPKLGFNYGRGQMQMNHVGLHDIYFAEFDEHISLTKPVWYFKNLFFGGMYVDIGGEVSGKSFKTNCSIKCQLHEKVSDTKNSYITA